MSPRRRPDSGCDQRLTPRLEDDQKRPDAGRPRSSAPEAEQRSAPGTADRPRRAVAGPKKAGAVTRERVQDLRTRDAGDPRRASEAARREALLARKRAEAEAREERVPLDGGPLPPADVRREER